MKTPSISLFHESRPDMDMNITASINEAGDLLIEGYDSGPLVKELKGDLDYEYKMAITKSQKENLIKKLAQELQQDLDDEN